MGAGGGWHSMPDDRPGFPWAGAVRVSNGEILDALGIEMNLATLIASKTFQKLGEGAFRTMPAVNEG